MDLQLVNTVERKKVNAHIGINYYVFLFISIQIVNTLTLSSYWSLLVTIPQIFVVLHFLLNKASIKQAILWHVVFSVTACDLNNLDEGVILLSYPSLKLYGPLTISYIILGFIWIKARFTPVKLPKDSLFIKLKGLFALLLIGGALLGLVGLLLWDNSVAIFIGSFRYMLIAFIYTDIFARIYDIGYLKKCVAFSLALLIASPMATFIDYFVLGLGYNYSIFISFMSNSVFVLSPILLLCLFYKPIRVISNVSMLLVSLLCYFALIFSSGRGGHMLGLTVALFIIAYFSFFNKKDSVIHVGIGGRIIFAFAIFIFAIAGAYLFQHVGDSLASNKLNQLVSLSFMFNGGSGLSEVATSPYIRIAEVLDVIDNGLHNIFALLLGRGYGGFFTDSLHLFNGIDLSVGGFSDLEIRTGRYRSPHSMVPNVLLFHGVIGLFFVIRIAVIYLKKINITPFVFPAFSLLLYSLYYNVPLIAISTLILYSAEYEFGKRHYGR